MQQQGPPPSAAGVPSITLSNMWKATLLDADFDSFSIDCGAHTSFGSRFWMAEPSNNPPPFAMASVGSTRVGFVDLQSMQAMRKFDRSQLKLGSGAEIQGIAPADNLSKFFLIHNDWDTGKGAGVTLLDAQTGATQEVITNLGTEKFVTGSKFGRSAGGAPPGWARVHEASGRPVREYKLRVELTRLLNAADPNIFFAGGRATDENLIGLFDIRAPGDLPQRMFPGVNDVLDMDFPRNPGTELTATPRYDNKTKIFDIGTGRVVFEFDQGTMGLQAQCCTVRWGSLFGIFRNSADDIKPIRLYDLTGPKGAGAPEKEFNTPCWAHQARITPDLRTILLRRQDSPERYQRISGYADPPAPGGFGQPAFGLPQGAPGGPGYGQQPGFPPQGQAQPGFPPQAQLAYGQQPVYPPQGQGQPGAQGFGTSQAAYPAVTFGSIFRATQLDQSDVRVGPAGRGRSIWWMAEPSNSPPQWASALAQTTQIAFPNFQGPATTPRVFDRAALKIGRDAEIMGIHPSNLAATGFWFIYNDWSTGRGATVAHIDPNTGMTQEIIADTTQNPYLAITGCAGGFVTGSGFGRGAGGQPPAYLNVHEASGRPVRSYKVLGEVWALLADFSNPANFFAGGAQSGMNPYLGLWDTRQPGEFPARQFMGIAGLSDLKFPRLPGNQLSATDLYESKLLLWDVGSGRQMGQIPVDGQRSNRSVSHVRWNNLLAVFEASSSSNQYAPIRFFDLNSPSGINAPVHELRPVGAFTPAEANFTPDLRTIVVGNTGECAFRRIAGFADGPMPSGAGGKADKKAKGDKKGKDKKEKKDKDKKKDKVSSMAPPSHGNAGYPAQGQGYPQGGYPPQGQYGQPAQYPQGQQYPPQGQYPPPGQQGYPPQGQYPAQGQYPPQSQYPPQGQYPPQSQYPLQGQYPPQGQYAQGQYPPQGYPQQYGQGYPQQYPGYPPQGGQ